MSGSGGGAGKVRWNEETQRWEVGAGPVPVPPPMPTHTPVGPPRHDESASAVSYKGMTRLVALSPSAGSLRRSALVVAVAVAVISGGLVGGLMVLRNDGPGSASSSASSSAAGSSASGPGAGAGTADSQRDPSDEVSARASSEVPTEVPSATLPDGYQVSDDPEGFRIAFPVGWERDSRSSLYGIDVVDYRSPSGGTRMQLFQLMEESPYASLLEAAQEAERLDGYERITLEKEDGSEREAATHEYRADKITGDAGTGTRHVVDHRFEAEDGNLYAIVVYGWDTDGAEDEWKLLDTARAWFCPPGTVC